MPKYITCRYAVKPQESEPAKRLCLAWTVDGLHCKDHVGQPEKDLAAFMAKPIKPAAAPAPAFAPRRIWP